MESGYAALTIDGTDGMVDGNGSKWGVEMGGIPSRVRDSLIVESRIGSLSFAEASFVSRTLLRS